MNRLEAEQMLTRLRREGAVVVPLAGLADVEEWRREVRRIARTAGMRIRTTVHAGQGYVLVDHVDHVTTDMELLAANRVLAGGLDGSPVSWDEALDLERRAAIRLVRNRK